MCMCMCIYINIVKGFDHGGVSKACSFARDSFSSLTE